MSKVINVDFNNMDEVFDAMVEEQAKQCRKEQDDLNSKKTATNVLVKFRDYITSARFKMKCFFDSKETGVNYKVLKNGYISRILGKIADVLGLTIDVCGEVVMYAVKFITNLINSVVNLAVTLVKKIISLFTLNCGEHCHA
jgi:hypothetical protein